MTGQVCQRIRRGACALVLFVSVGMLLVGTGCASGSVNCECDCWPCGQFGPTNACLCEDPVDECPKCAGRERVEYLAPGTVR